MIFVTLGTQKQSFDRLLNQLKNINLKEKIVVQTGHTKFKSDNMEIFDFISYEDMNQYIAEADIVITHGGTGSIITPLKMRKKIIACARLSKFGEHIDDHQSDIVDIFSERGYIIKLDEKTKLAELLDSINDFKPKKFKPNTYEFVGNLKKSINNLL